MMARFTIQGSVRSFLLLIAGCTVLGILFFQFMYYGQNGVLPSFRDRTKSYLLAILVTNFLGITMFLLDRVLDHLVQWKANFLLRFLSGIGVHILLVVVFFTITGESLLNIAGEELFKLIILFTIAIFIYEIFYGLFYSYRQYAVLQAEQLRSERWQLELQFESLKSQISPHYLFNCLNTVSSLLYKDTHLAEEFIRRMADTFRYVLTHQRQKLVTLRDELDFVKSYYFLLQVRYEYHLQLEINVPQNILDTHIPPMTLQLLVENAVKHNTISRDQPLLVYISSDGASHLHISNTKTSPVAVTSGFHVGLENIHKRYSFFSPEKIAVYDKERFTVQLPILKSIHLLSTGV